MSSGFYAELIEEITELIAQGRFEEARTKVDTELAMPYVPSDILPVLRQFDQQLRGLAAENRRPSAGGMSLDEIEESLKGGREQQLKAVDAMHGMNLRSCLDLVRVYLKSDPDPLASALLIDSLIEQQINEELTLNRDGIQYTFIPRYQEGAAESDGFLAARSQLREWLENENPSLFNLCEQVLIREAYLALPLGFEEEEGVSLAASCVHLVYCSMQDEEGWRQFASQQQLENVNLFDLKSQFI